MDEVIGTTGKTVDFVKENFTEEECKAICIVNNMTKRLNIGIRFQGEYPIEVCLSHIYNVVRESVFLNIKN